MRKAIIPLLLLALLTGCSDEEGGTTESHANFQKALNTFNEAQQGFITKGDHVKVADSEMAGDYSYYRQQKLEQAATELKAITNKGSDSERLDATLLLADAEASTANYAARRAMANWADLARRSAALTDQLLVVNDAAARVASLNIDLGPLLEKLHEDQQAMGNEIAAQEKEAQRLHDTAAQDQQVINGLRTQSDAEQARGQTLRGEAFNKNGKTQDELYSQAKDARSGAIAASSSSQKQAAEMDVCLSELDILHKQIELHHAASQALDDEIARLQKQQTRNQELHDAAVTDKDQAIKKLQDLLEVIAKDYADKVDAPLTQAQKRASEAATMLAGIVNKAHGTQRRQIQLDLLVKRTIVSSVMAQHVYAASSYCRTLEVLAAQSDHLMPGVSVFNDAFHQAKDARDALGAAAKTAIGQAITLANELQHGNDDKATDIFNQLQTYAHNVDDALGTVPPPAPAAATAPAA